MQRARIAVVCAVVFLTTVGIPAHTPAVSAAPARLVELPLRASIVRGTDARIEPSLPWRANLVGIALGARGAHDATIRLRAHTADGWRSYDVHVDPDERADAGHEPRAVEGAFSTPVWVGTADRVALDVRAGDHAVRDLRLFAVNTMGDADPAPVRWVRAAGSFLTMQPAHADPIDPDIITRKEWGADESLRSNDGPGTASELRNAIVHHTAGSNDYTKAESAAVVRGIYAYHTKGRGYSDIGYNFLVDRYGQIFEGRKGSILEPVIGGHAGGFNTFATGVSLMGTFTSARPTDAMLSSLKRVLAWKLDLHHVPPTGKVTVVAGSGSTKYDAGEKVSLPRISGHRDVGATACPGQRVYDRLTEIRGDVADMGHPKIYLPDVRPGELRPDGDGANDVATFTAGFSREVDWRLRITDAGGVAWRTIAGTGTALEATWDGASVAGVPVPIGRYRWTLTAERSTTGHPATPATGIVDVVAPVARGCAGCAALAPGADFDGDGFGDLAIGVPGDDLDEVRDAGSVNVLSGSSTGLSAAGDQLWTVDDDGVAGIARAGDGFGSALAAGDFDGDGYDDLAVGSPGALGGGVARAGAVNVFFGGGDGLANLGDVRIDRGEDAATGAAFGAALTAGDFDGDGYDDLAIGAPGADGAAGAAVVLYGASVGLGQAETWSQDAPGVRGRAEALDRFGAALTAGDLDGDGRDDLVAGAHGEGVGLAPGAGRVHVLFGSGSGLNAIDDQRWSLNNVGVDPERAESGDAFGFALATGDVNGDGTADLAVGAPGETLLGRAGAGAIVVLPGSNQGPTTDGASFWHQGSEGVPGANEAGDGFGASLTMRRLDPDLFADVVAGIPGEDIGDVNDAGSAMLLRGSATGPLALGTVLWSENTEGVAGSPEAGDVFAFALGAGDFNGDLSGDLVAGLPGQEVAGLGEAGVVAVIPGGASGLNAGADRRWHRDVEGVRGEPGAMDLLGAA